MSVIGHLENAVSQIENEKNSLIQQAKDKAMREQILPHNREVDGYLEKAVAELNENLSKDYAKLQEKFAIDKQALVEKAQKNKSEFAENVIATETASIVIECDTAIAQLQKQIKALKG